MRCFFLLITPFLTLIESHFSKCVSPSVSLSDFLLHWLLSSSSWTMAPPALKFRWKTDEFQTGIILIQSKGWEGWVIHANTTGLPTSLGTIGHWWTLTSNGCSEKNQVPLSFSLSYCPDTICLLLSFFIYYRFLVGEDSVPNRPTFIQDFLIDANSLHTACWTGQEVAAEPGILDNLTGPAFQQTATKY